MGNIERLNRAKPRIGQQSDDDIDDTTEPQDEIKEKCHITLSERFLTGGVEALGLAGRSVSLAIRLKRCILSRTLSCSAGVSWLDCDDSSGVDGGVPASFSCIVFWLLSFINTHFRHAEENAHIRRKIRTTKPAVQRARVFVSHQNIERTKTLCC